MEKQDLMNRALLEFQSIYSTGKAFILSEAPQVIQEYLTWICIESVINIACFLISTVCSLLLAKSIINSCNLPKYKTVKCNMECLTGIAEARIILAGVGILMLFIFGAHKEPIGSTKTLLKAKYAPKILLLEKTSDLIK